MSRINLSVLNKNQLDAVLDTEGRVLVLAGAGSGKTRVLTYRIAHLILDCMVYPSQILAITFTNKASGEMKERLQDMVGEDCSVWVSTFHSFCATVLRSFADRIGYNSNYSIYDESDSTRVLKKAMIELAIEDDVIKDIVREYISEAKNSGLEPEQFFARSKGENDNAEECFKIYKRYEELLKISNAMDFDDLLIKVVKLFNDCPDVLQKYQNKFKYIHVDEFQDTNEVQYEIVKMLSAKSGNLFVVGDDDQSIYGWRGAKVENILNFDKLFTDAKIYKLQQNYRSTNKILISANNVIKNNTSRHPKELFSDKGDGIAVQYYSAYNDYQEAEWVIDNIKQLKRFSGYSNKDFAILIRVNSLSRLFENKMSTANFNYKVLGGFKFFDRKEIQDVIAYMRLIANPKDTQAIERIINFPRRGIGETTVETMTNFGRGQLVSLIDIILNISQHKILGAGTVKKIEEFKCLIVDLVEHKTLPLDEFVKYLVEKVGFEEAYTSTGKEDDEVRLDNIQQFVRHVKDYKKSKPEATLEDFIQTVSLVPESGKEVIDKDTITLATMHAVKGLEYKVVFIVGCEEDVFPSSMCLKNDNGIEEERRVMYVAITRAQERLYITNAASRFRFNSVKNNLPSRFISESKGIMPEDTENSYQNYAQKRDALNARFVKAEDTRDIYGAPKTNYSPKPILPSPPQVSIINSDLTGFVAGGRVEHPKYGKGTIIFITGSGISKTATIEFSGLGVKKFALASAPLKPIS